MINLDQEYREIQKYYDNDDECENAEFISDCIELMDKVKKELVKFIEERISTNDIFHYLYTGNSLETDYSAVERELRGIEISLDYSDTPTCEDSDGANEIKTKMEDMFYELTRFIYRENDE